jgi:predicted nucleic acid-binding Zn finger protein
MSPTSTLPRTALFVFGPSFTDPRIMYPIQLPYCACSQFKRNLRVKQLPFCDHLDEAYTKIASWREVDGTMIRVLVCEVLDRKGVSRMVYLPYCGCPDMAHRDMPGVGHICKHIGAELARREYVIEL